jgi:hypothetical protein
MGQDRWSDTGKKRLTGLEQTGSMTSVIMKHDVNKEYASTRYPLFIACDTRLALSVPLSENQHRKEEGGDCAVYRYGFYWCGKETG